MADSARGAPGTPQWFGLWDGQGQLDQSATLAGFPVDDKGAADLIRSERPDQLHYVPVSETRGTWYIWDGRCHLPDTSGQINIVVADYGERSRIILRIARQLVAQRSRNAVLAADPDATNTAIEQAARKAWQPWEAAEKYHLGLRKTASANSLRGMLTHLSGTDEHVMADRWPEHLNCANGVVCLRTGNVYLHDPRWMMTYCLRVPYNPAARGAGWEAMGWHVAGENGDVARYLIKMLGYSLLGDNRKQLIFFLTGPTGSGKSQLVETVAKVAGPLAHASSSALISRARERHPRVEHSIVGKRFVYIDESAERIHIDEGQLKRLTGSATMSVSRLYKDTEVPVAVTWTPWNATNEMPTLSGFDDAIRRRLRAIPCGSTIPEPQREEGLSDRLAAQEGEAVLATLVWGAMTYLAEGERCPPEVELATAEYEAEQNTAESFRSECTMEMPAWQSNGHGQQWPTQAQIQREYVAWCQATRTPMLPKHAFNKAFRELPGINYDPNQRRYPGITVVRSHLEDRQDH